MCFVLVLLFICLFLLMGLFPRQILRQTLASLGSEYSEHGQTGDANANSCYLQSLVITVLSNWCFPVKEGRKYII